MEVIIDDFANYVVIGKMLMERHPTLSWTRCATRCIDLMHEDEGKIYFIKEVFDWDRSITKLIYNHAFVLNIVRRFIGNRELVHLSITCFVTSIIYL